MRPTRVRVLSFRPGQPACVLARAAQVYASLPPLALDRGGAMLLLASPNVTSGPCGPGIPRCPGP